MDPCETIMVADLGISNLPWFFVVCIEIYNFWNVKMDSYSLFVKIWAFLRLYWLRVRSVFLKDQKLLIDEWNHFLNFLIVEIIKKGAVGVCV